MRKAILASRLDDEKGRLFALERYEVLDTISEPQFDNITALICSALNVPMAALSLLDRDRQWFKSRQNIELHETARDIAFCDHTIRTPSAMIVCDARLDPRFAENPLVQGAPHVLSYAGAPLQSPDGYNIGTLCALDTRARSFSRSHIDMLENLAAVAVDALEVRMIANFDHLTGALSRRAFLSQLDLALNRWQVRGTPAALILFDLDHFKRVNDNYGHAAGDAVLREVTKTCHNLLRDDAVIGRVGGEEFGVALPATDSATAMMVAETLRTAIAAMKIVELPGVAISASFGIAGLDSAIVKNAQWMAKADAALYSAKHLGRNRCKDADRLGIGISTNSESAGITSLPHIRRQLRT